MNRYVVTIICLFLFLTFPSGIWADGNQECLDCHEGQENNEIDLQRFNESVHSENECIDCHFDAEDDHEEGNLKHVDCLECHEVEGFYESIHGKLLLQNDPDAPNCSFCHGKHYILSKNNIDSPIFPLNTPALCGQCHREGERASVRPDIHQSNIYRNYTESIHGKGLSKSGLLMAATCVSCHTPHNELPVNDPLSSVHSNNIARTCSSCHYHFEENLKASIHSSEVSRSKERLPSCNDCHSAHTINKTDLSEFRFYILKQCGACHKKLAESYFETYHGKVSKLGEEGAAKCHDCHGAHNILPQSDPRSTLHPNNLVKTCRKCHPGANQNFVGYLVHLTHGETEKYPVIHYFSCFMKILLIGTMAFFLLHMFLWLARLLVDRFKERPESEISRYLSKKGKYYYQRFSPIHSLLHLMIIVSFLGLAITGMILKFPDLLFFAKLSQFLGGPHISGKIHRICAIITFAYIGIHLVMLVAMLKKRQITLKGLLREDYSMIPLFSDLKALWQNFRWFLGMGEKPEFGRWTYWEKFDYLAVFWGIIVIGVSGLILWFPEAASKLFPGRAINIAALIHSEEALLATAFIFSIHFFNTHFRPGKFPMDPVIFTGRMPLKELKEERALQYKKLVKNRSLGKHLAPPPPRWLVRMAMVFGLSFLSIGILIIGAILYAMVFVY